MAKSLSTDIYPFKNDPDFKDCRQILPGIYTFSEFPTYDCVVYAVVDKRGQICLIDAGNGRSFDAVLMAMEMAQLNSTKIKSIFLTHAHPDHVFGVYRLYAYYAQQQHVMPSIYAHSKLLEVFRRADEGAFHLDELGLKPSDFRIQIEPLQGNVLKDGDVFRFGNHQFKVLETPGHNSSALCFFEITNQILFSGDTILAGGKIGRYDGGFDSSLQELKHSIARLRNIKPLHLLPGHGEIILQNAANHINASWDNVTSLK